jgi:glycine/D-amino acid oxidase-like deaminating enzyme/nitrite reductase/ring-hydroxylating ferredoxin subunit
MSRGQDARMKVETGSTPPVWFESAAVPSTPPLGRDEKADVCVVGAGLSGLTTAWFLAREGLSVVVVDDGPVAGGETSRTTAHLVSALDDYYHELERLHGKDGARIAAQSHTAAIDAIERIVVEAAIDCDFHRVDGYLFGDGDTISAELDAARRAGLEVERVKRVPVSFHPFGGALRFANQAQVHPLKYLAGLARALLGKGVRIYSGAHVTGVEEDETVVVRTERGPSVRARAAVVATNTPMIDRVVMHTKQAPYRTYAVAAAVPAESVPRLLLWDTEDPYHYVRTQQGAGHDWLIVGGEDHKTGQPEDGHAPYGALESWLRERFPMAKEIRHRWSGQVMEPVDGLAFIGRNPGDDHIYIVTGDSGNGTTHGTIAGLLIADLIGGRRNPWAGLYDPSRKSLRAARDFAAENLNVAAQYAEHLTAGDEETVSALAPGDGAVLRRGARKIAVYRDDGGELHHLTATCPHLGCIVEWNAAEKSWDCPCHGSRFDRRDGHVLNGPATHGLKQWAELET